MSLTKSIGIICKRRLILNKNTIWAPIIMVAIYLLEFYTVRAFLCLSGWPATTVSLILGVAYGAVAGHKGGKADAVMMRIVDVLYALPFMFFVILLIVFLVEILS